MGLEGRVDAQSLESHCSTEDVNKCQCKDLRRQVLVSTKHCYLKPFSQFRMDCSWSNKQFPTVNKAKGKA